MPLNDAPAGDAAVLHHAKVAVFLAVFLASFGTQKHADIALSACPPSLTRGSVGTTRVSAGTGTPGSKKIKRLRSSRPGRGGSFSLESAKFG